MKWIKTQNGNIIRLGAISEFVLKEKDIEILIGEITEQGGFYNCYEQLNSVYDDLLNFIIETDNNGIFYFPQSDDNMWLKIFDISELELSVKEHNACLRSGIRTVYDLMPDSNGWERIIRGIGKNALIELHKKRDEFVRNKLNDKTH